MQTAFVPKLWTTLRTYDRRQFGRRCRRRHHRRHRRDSARHRVRHRERRDARSRALDGHRCWFSHLRARRVTRPDRRPDRRVRRHRLRHRAEVRRRWTHRRHVHGRRAACRHGGRQAREHDQVHPASGRHRIHERDRGHHLLESGERPLRSAHGGSAGRVPREMGVLRRACARADPGRRRRRRAHVGDHRRVAPHQPPRSRPVRGADRGDRGDLAPPSACRDDRHPVRLDSTRRSRIRRSRICRSRRSRRSSGRRSRSRCLRRSNRSCRRWSPTE